MAAALLLLGGCSTHLSTLPITGRTGQTEAVRGMNYSLPMLQYRISATYRLTACNANQAGRLVPTFKIQAEAAHQYGQGEAYRIDPTSLSGPLKTTDVAIETYAATGNLQSINASVVSHEAEFIESMVALGIDLASLANPATAGMSVVSAEAGSDQELANQFIAANGRPMLEPVCTPEAISRLAAAATRVSEVERLTPLVTADTQQIEAIARRAALRLASTADRRRMAEVQDRLIANSTALEAAKSALTEAQGKLGFSQALEWPIDPFALDESLALDPAMSTSADELVDQMPVLLAGPDGLERALQDPAAPERSSLTPEAVVLVRNAIAELRSAQRDRIYCEEGLSDLQCLQGRLGLHATLQMPGDSIGLRCPDGSSSCLPAQDVVQARDDIADSGIFIRPPGRARLVLCDWNSPCAGTSRRPVLQTPVVSAPQAGQLRFIELQSGPFESNLLSIKLREDGSVEKLQYASRAAVAADLAASAAGAAAAIEADRDARREARRTEEAYQREQVAAGRAERAAIRTEDAAVRAEEIAGIQHQIDLLQRERTLLEVAENRQVVPRELTEERARIEAETALLRARLALLQAARDFAQAETD